MKKKYVKPNIMIERFEMDIDITVSAESERYKVLKEQYDNGLFESQGITWDEFLKMSNIDEDWCYYTSYIPS